jgi:hypothetical protein
MLLLGVALASTVPVTSSQSVESLRYLIGTWRVVSTGPGGGDELRVCYSIQPFVGDKWLSGVATSSASRVESKDVWGRDDASGQLFRTIFDASGTYAIVRSPGWNGETLVLNGDARSGGGTMQVRETIRRVSANEFKATWEALRGGKWGVYAIETATRVANGNCSAP